MSNARCDLTELLVDQCACREHRGGEIINLDHNHAPTEPEQMPAPRTFEANHPGKCVCGTRWAVGDRIAYNCEDELVGTQCCTGDL